MIKVARKSQDLMMTVTGTLMGGKYKATIVIGYGVYIVALLVAMTAVAIYAGVKALTN